jgi:hypothetical protein
MSTEAKPPRAKKHSDNCCGCHVSISLQLYRLEIKIDTVIVALAKRDNTILDELTAKLKAGNDELEKTVAANQHAGQPAE